MREIKKKKRDEIKNKIRERLRPFHIHLPKKSKQYRLLFVVLSSQKFTFAYLSDEIVLQVVMTLFTTIVLPEILSDST